MNADELNRIVDYLSSDDRETDIVSVSAPTGSGKSLFLPRKIVTRGQMRIFVAVPTVTAAMALARTSRQMTPKIKIGTGAEGEANYSDDSLIVYMTHGHLVNILFGGIKNGAPVSFPDIDVLMVDEAHLGTIDITLSILLWIFFKKNGSQEIQENLPVLLISSATLPAEQIPSLQGVGFIQNFVFGNRKFDVKIEYHNRSFSPERKDVYDQMVAVTLKMLTSKNAPGGHYLLFVPGSAEANKMKMMLQTALERQRNLVIYAAYSALGYENLEKMIEPDEYGRRKIIISTNVFETSLTVDDVGVVIDSGLEKIAVESDSGGTFLQTVFVSKSSAIQRAGRTGRTRNGICYRMYTEEKYQSLPEIRADEIDRVPIFKQVLQCWNTGIAPLSFFEGVNPEKIFSTQEYLRKKGFIRRKNLWKVSRSALEAFKNFKFLPKNFLRSWARDEIAWAADSEKKFFFIDLTLLPEETRDALVVKFFTIDKTILDEYEREIDSFKLMQFMNLPDASEEIAVVTLEKIIPQTGNAIYFVDVDLTTASPKIQTAVSTFLQGKKYVQLDHIYEVQDVGKFTLALPLGIKTGLFLYKWIALPQSPSVFPAILLTAILENYEEGYFYLPPPPAAAQKNKELYDQYLDEMTQIRDGLKKEYGGPEPLEMLLTLFKRVLKYTFENSDDIFNPPRREFNTWCVENHLNARRIREALSTMKRTHRICERILESKIKIGTNFKISAFFEIADPILISIYKENILTGLVSDSGKEFQVRGIGIYSNHHIGNRILVLTFQESLVWRNGMPTIYRNVGLYRTLPDENEEVPEIDLEEVDTALEEFVDFDAILGEISENLNAIEE